MRRTGGRAKNSARIRYGLRMTVVRAGFEPWRVRMQPSKFSRAARAFVLRHAPARPSPVSRLKTGADYPKMVAEPWARRVFRPTARSPRRPFAVSPIRRFAVSPLTELPALSLSSCVSRARGERCAAKVRPVQYWPLSSALVTRSHRHPCGGFLMPMLECRPSRLNRAD
jgi:hypothetical protein